MGSAELTSAVSSKRQRLILVPKDGVSAGTKLCQKISVAKSDFCVMGFYGRKGRKDSSLLASNVMEVIKHGSCSLICIKDEAVEMLPIKRPTVFVVSVNLNRASTKAFLDALRLSQPGDEIHVVYCVNHLENVDNIYTEELKKKYTDIFEALGADVLQAF